jgi:hypothetical protein
MLSASGNKLWEAVPLGQIHIKNYINPGLGER